MVARSLERCRRIGAIFPAISNAIVAFKLMGVPKDDEDLNRQLNAMEDLIVDDSEGNLLPTMCISNLGHLLGNVRFSRERYSNRR